MKKNLLALVIFLTAGTAATYAAPACVTGGTLASYVALGAGGCENGDKIFANFSYSGATGTDPTAAGIAVGLDNNAGIKQFGLQFQSNTTVWTSSGFTLGYTITIDQTQCGVLYGSGSVCSIIAAQGAFQGGLAPNAASMTMALTPGGTISLNDLTTNANTQQISLVSSASTSVLITGTGASSTAPIDTFGLDVYQTTAAPEPMTLSLVGGGLLGLGMLRRKKVVRP